MSCMVKREVNAINFRQKSNHLPERAGGHLNVTLSFLISLPFPLASVCLAGKGAKARVAGIVRLSTAN